VLARSIFFTALLLVSCISSQAQSAPVPARFEVATIRLNTECIGGGGHEQLSPGRYSVECVSLRDYIRVAFGSGRGPTAQRPQVLGGPGWLDTDRYDIVAKAAADAGYEEMYGPMMQALLEERFRLKVHTEVRELPAYVLSVANPDKMVPAKEGSCVPFDMKDVLKSPPPPNFCGRTSMKKGATNIFDGYGITLGDLINHAFQDALDHPVIDRTGLTGRYDVHLEFLSDEAALSGDNAGAVLATALREKLGLKLSSEKGAVEVLVIDSVEKPTEN
jgi:uncharacterized protein (TIGR03435 family)